MKLSDKWYWFSRNFVNFILSLIFLPFFLLWYMITTIINGFYITFFITNGSTAINPPWKWQWWGLD